MIGKISLLLALCAFSGVLCLSPPYGPPAVSIRTGPGNGFEEPCSPTCYDAIREWLMRQGCMVPQSQYADPYYPVYPGGTGSSGGGMYDTWLDVTFYDGRVETVRVVGQCFGYQMCNKCGSYGQCILDSYQLPICQCKEGWEGPYCTEEGKPGDNLVIIVVVVIAGVLAFVIIMAIVIHLCCKNKGGDDCQKQKHVHVAPAPHHGVAQTHGHPCTAASSRVGPSCPLPVQIHAVTHAQGPHVFPSIQPIPPFRSSVTITELDDEGRPKCDDRGVVKGIPCHGIYPRNPSRPCHENVYTTIPM